MQIGLDSKQVHNTPKQHFAKCVCSLMLLLGSAWVAPVAAQDTVGSLSGKHFIIGGEPVIENVESPWIVALASNNEADLFQRQFCGGSLIADQWVLTAAHCLFDRNGSVISTNSFTVAINAANLLDEDASELLVTNIIIHPDYNHNANNPHSDLALLELATSSGIEPVSLSTKSSDQLVGLDSTVRGWGATVFDDPTEPRFPVVLHTVDLPIVSLDVCNSPLSYDGAILENQLCAGFAAGGRDSCVGDSGGPMTVTIDGRKQQAGIVSFGLGCAEPNFYGVYTDVPFFIGWINQFVFVGEPEFEPEVLSARATVESSTGVSGNSDVASVHWWFLLLAGVGLLRKRCLA